jgi:hypothetical protein
MGNLLTAVSLAGDWTHWWVVYKVALCNPRLRHTTPVGLLWTSDWPTAGTSTWQHTTLTRDRHPCLHWIQTCSLSKQVVTDPRCRMHGSWDRLFWHLVDTNTVWDSVLERHFVVAWNVCSLAVYKCFNWAYERQIRGENLLIYESHMSESRGPPVFAYHMCRKYAV